MTFPPSWPPQARSEAWEVYPLKLCHHDDPPRPWAGGDYDNDDNDDNDDDDDDDDDDDNDNADDDDDDDGDDDDYGMYHDAGTISQN